MKRLILLRRHCSSSRSIVPDLGLAEQDSTVVEYGSHYHQNHHHKQHKWYHMIHHKKHKKTTGIMKKGAEKAAGIDDSSF